MPNDGEFIDTRNPDGTPGGTGNTTPDNRPVTPVTPGGGANADGSPTPTGDPVVDALNQQNWIAQQGLNEQKQNDQGLLDQAYQNEIDQEHAYADQLTAAQAAAAQQSKDNAAALAEAKSASNSQAAMMAQQYKLAQDTFTMQEQNINRLNQKAPDVAAITGAAQQQMRSGQSSTMLTGPGGIDTGKLFLGCSPVLGNGTPAAAAPDSRFSGTTLRAAA